MCGRKPVGAEPFGPSLRRREGFVGDARPIAKPSASEEEVDAAVRLAHIACNLPRQCVRARRGRVIDVREGGVHPSLPAQVPHGRLDLGSRRHAEEAAVERGAARPTEADSEEEGSVVRARELGHEDAQPRDTVPGAHTGVVYLGSGVQTLVPKGREPGVERKPTLGGGRRLQRLSGH